MTFQVTKPGIFLEVSATDYFADPCPTPSLTQSIAKILIDQSPLHAWYAHPRLNPDWEPDDPTKFDVGNVAHKLLIGRGKEIEVVEGFDDWRKGAARDARDIAAAQGRLAVLGKTFQRASNMVAAAREQLELRGLPTHIFVDRFGHGEVVLAWQEGNLWLRQMVDWLSSERLTFVDFKTTAMSVAPHNLDRMMATAGWPIQAAMAERGLDVLDPDNAGRRRYLFVVQEDTRPYALNVVELTEGPMTMGRKMLQHGVDIWRRCIEANRWPGYPAEIVTPSYPGWAETQWLDREIAHDERRRTVVWDDEVRGTNGRPMLTDLAGG